MFLPPLLRLPFSAPGSVSGPAHAASPGDHSAHSILLLRRPAPAPVLVLVFALTAAFRFAQRSLCSIISLVLWHQDLLLILRRWSCHAHALGCLSSLSATRSLPSLMLACLSWLLVLLLATCVCLSVSALRLL